ncbi:PLP-dependent transferase [Lentinus tigrinus ALCF2SS1-7]|uniref:PLP-dependent transferase n=1 Tax=Lentinus tigrinus ALCF2SS1-6 TaxID=1328759 RepID=A0A5C2S3G4_9APHY|nr:PLP-dependent transferase [Lentinus tigrinus ALCF2SS1-6]RPD72281.1 PLP-dependent transferase [Lentinus tigrinus ALCF2SS1-7]
MATLDISTARSAFRALNSGCLFADNAGGSQCLFDVVSRISDYLINTNVQLGADYFVSVNSTNRVASGSEAARELFNADSVDEIAYGSSSTMLVENLSRAMEADIQAGEEIIITGEHESNAGPWKRLAARKGAVIKLWPATQLPEYPNNPYAVGLQLDTLKPLITSKTRLIAFTACSNILGSLIPVEEIVKTARALATELGVRKLEFCLDCVAYAPHRQMDVRKWDVDYCYFSFYKVYGPHASVMYVRASSLTGSLTSLGHHFLDIDTKPYKLQPGGPGYELVYGCTGVPPYLRSLTPSGSLEDAWAVIAAHEQTLLEPLLAYLRGKADRGVRIVGEEKAGLGRVPTVSFVVVGERAIRSPDVVSVFDKKGNVGIRYGHFYAYTLVDMLEPKVDVNDGVVRISLVHYNTVEEVQRIVKILDEVLA